MPPWTLPNMATTSDDPADRLWAAALQDLRFQMARETFQQWLQGSRVVESGDGTLTIGIVPMYGADWLQHRLRGVIERAVGQIAGRPITVSFVASCSNQEHSQEHGARDQVLAYPAGKEEEVPAHPAGKEEPKDEEQQDGEASSPGRLARAGGPGWATGREPAQSQQTGDDEELTSLDYYIRIKTAFRFRALAELSGSEVKVFLCIALHLDRDGTAKPGLETIMKETDLSRSAVCSALARLVCLGLVTKRVGHHRKTSYVVEGYAWFGPRPAPALWEQS